MATRVTPFLGSPELGRRSASTSRRSRAEAPLQYSVPISSSRGDANGGAAAAGSGAAAVSRHASGSPQRPTTEMRRGDRDDHASVLTALTLVSSAESDDSASDKAGRASERAFSTTTCLLVALIVAGGTASTIAATDSAERWVVERAAHDAVKEGNDLTAFVQHKLDMQLSLMALLAEVAAVDEHGMLASWDAVSQPVLNRLSGALAVGALRRLSRSQRASWEHNMSAAVGLEEAAVNIMALDGSVSEEREQYIVMQHASPPDPLLAWRDVGALPSHTEAASAAIATRATVIAGPGPLLRGTDGFLAWTPLFVGNEAWGVLGFSTTVDELLTDAFAGVADGVGVSICETASGKVLFRGGAASGGGYTEALRTSVSYAQQTWSVDVTMSSEYIAAHDNGVPRYMTIIGAMLTAVLGLSIVMASVCLNRHTRALSRATISSAHTAHNNVLRFIFHELRSPLHALMAQISLVEEEPVVAASETLQGALRFAHAQAVQMQSVLDDVMDIRAVEVGRISLRPTIVDARDIVRDVGNHFWSILGSPKVRLQVGAAAQGHHWLDAGRVRQVLNNAMHNACRFTASGKITLTVASVTAAEQDAEDWLVFQVRNEGPGLARGAPVAEWAAQMRARAPTVVPAQVLKALDDDLPELHDLSQAQMPQDGKTGAKLARRPTGPGVLAVKTAGLDLRLCRRIVRHMHGWLALDDLPQQPTAVAGAVGAGATRITTRFWFAIPVKRARGPDFDSMSGTAVLSPESRASPEQTGASGPSGAAQASGGDITIAGPTTESEARAEHVLVVDDDLVLRRMGARMCLALGVNVSVMADGNEAIAALKAPMEPKFTCVLLDIVMRHSNGVDVCRELRRLGVTIPIYAMTGNVDAASRAKYRQSGFVGMVGKPFSKQHIAEVVAHAKATRAGRPREWYSNMRS